MGYYNPIYIYGVERFLADAKAAGVDGLIVVDLPPEEDEELCLPALKAGLNFIRLATPTTDDKRLPTVLAEHVGLRLLRLDDRHHRFGDCRTPARSPAPSSASRATPTCRSASASASRPPTMPPPSRVGRRRRRRHGLGQRGSGVPRRGGPRDARHGRGRHRAGAGPRRGRPLGRQSRGGIRLLALGLARPYTSAMTEPDHLVPVQLRELRAEMKADRETQERRDKEA